MIFHTASKKHLFDNIKNGDFLAFYHRPWYFIFSRLIKIVTGNKIDHVAGVFNVIRKHNAVLFSVGEQTLSNNKASKEYSIIRFSEGNYHIDSRFRKRNLDLYLLSNRHDLDDSQNKELEKYWGEQEEYSFAELPFTINWIYSLFGNKKKVYDNNCSTAARQSMIRVGIRDAKFDDKVPNPTEFAKFSFIKSIVKIK